MGKVIVIEGSDGSGKATQTKLLYEALTAQGKKVKMVSYPCYESDSSALVKMYLQGAFGAGSESICGIFLFCGGPVCFLSEGLEGIL